MFYTKTLCGGDTFKTGLTLNYTDSEHDLLDNYKGVLPNASVQPNGLVHRIGSFTTLDWQIAYEFGRAEEITPETPAPGYSKEEKRLTDEAATSPKPVRSSAGIRQWLTGTTVTLGINNLFDAAPPFADNFQGYDAQTANSIGRYFYVELERKF
jgi:outer membrane receptor protein involved in Fe transport